MGESDHERRTEPTDTRRTIPADDAGHAVSESGWTTTDRSARALGVSPRTVRRFIDRGELEGRKVTEGIVEAWEVSIDSLYTLRDKRQSEGQVRRNVPRTSAQSRGSADVSADPMAYIQSLTDRLLQLTTEVEQLRARLQITERAESTEREQAERERAERLEFQESAERLRREAEEARERAEELEASRQEVEEEARKLREELEAERSKGFWRRLFGG